MTSTLGWTTHGHGAQRVLVLHDWFSDHTSWDGVRAYLAPDAATYAFADLRGYGRSRRIAGTYTLDEAADDAWAVADALGWSRLALVGHSMSSLVVQRMAQLAPDRVERLALLTPVPPTSMRLDDAGREMMRALALAPDEMRVAALRQAWGTRLGDAWIRLKVARWRETAAPEAVAAYVDLYGRADVSAGAAAVRAPMLVVTGAHDAPPFQEAYLKQALRPFYPQAAYATCEGSGHYPMQEQPPLLATQLERFLGA
jgi:pimeloyl-ACP methyl ester carboxylesterase